jgi:hypothetical protein
LFIFVILGTIARLHGFSIWKFIKYIKEELLIVLGTSSSESVLPRNAKGEKPNLWRLGKVTALCAHRPASGVRRALERLHELQLELVSGGDRGRVLEEGILRLCLD